MKKPNKRDIAATRLLRHLMKDDHCRKRMFNSKEFVTWATAIDKYGRHQQAVDIIIAEEIAAKATACDTSHKEPLAASQDDLIEVMFDALLNVQCALKGGEDFPLTQRLVNRAIDVARTQGTAK